MVFGSVLLAAYAATWLARGRPLRQVARWRFGMAVAMTVAGLMHLAEPTPFLQHLPGWVPAPELLVVTTGIIEMGLGPAILHPRWRHAAGLLLAAYLVAVFPANIYVAVAGVDVQGQPDGFYPFLRLLLQPVFILLVLWITREQQGPRPSPLRTGGVGRARGNGMRRTATPATSDVRRVDQVKIGPADDAPPP